MTAATTDELQQFRDLVFGSGLLTRTAEPGVYGRSATYEAVVLGVSALAHGLAPDESTTCTYFPPVISRGNFEATDYHRSFPNLMGSIQSFEGGDRGHRAQHAAIEAGGDWTAGLSDIGLTLCSAACHSLYPALAGTKLDDRVLLECESYCFRHEPSDDPARMQAFRMHEHVCLGSAADARSFRDRTLTEVRDLLSGLGLQVEIVPANDPFFGRAGQLLATGQLAATLKLEVVAPVVGPTAIASGNCHETHFGDAFGIVGPDGAPAHSACVGFGLDRITLALVRAHGADVTTWPNWLRSRLQL